jgi:hypothetical protein
MFVYYELNAMMGMGYVEFSTQYILILYNLIDKLNDGVGYSGLGIVSK